MTTSNSVRKILKFQCKEIVDHTPHLRELVLDIVDDPGNEFKFKAGQFVMLHVPQEHEKPALRAYSIASDDRFKKGFRLLFKPVEGGLATQFVWQLKGQEILDFTGPFGRVFFKEPPSPQVIFLNTGSGIAQHMSYLLSKQDLYPNLQYRMLIGLRSEGDIYYEKELKALQAKLPNFQFEYVLSRPSPQWSGKKGYVQDFLESFLVESVETMIYLCGNGGMIKEVKKKLEGQGFNKEKIFSEAFD